MPLIVDDLYSLDFESLATLQPIHALVFLFKWVANTDESGGAAGMYDDNFLGFFAHQVVNNAYATLAVLNALCNIPSLTMGPQLQDLISFTTGMDPQTRGLAITSSEFLREAHNSLSPPSAISLDGLRPPAQAEDAYHFVVYLPVFGSLYELDGLKRSPVLHGPVDDRGEGWVAKARLDAEQLFGFFLLINHREVIQSRIATYPPGSVCLISLDEMFYLTFKQLEFNLLAVRNDPLPSLQSQLQQFQASGNQAFAEEILNRISQENEKRTRWAVSALFSFPPHICSHVLMIFPSSRIV